MFANPVDLKRRRITIRPGAHIFLELALEASFFDNSSVMFCLLRRGGTVPIKKTGPIVCFL